MMISLTTFRIPSDVVFHLSHGLFQYKRYEVQLKTHWHRVDFECLTHWLMKHLLNRSFSDSRNSRSIYSVKHSHVGTHINGNLTKEFKSGIRIWKLFIVKYIHHMPQWINKKTN